MNEEARRMLGDNPHVITDKHYGNCIDKPLVTIYVKYHVMNHTKFNRLGFGIIVKSEMFK